MRKLGCSRGTPLESRRKWMHIIQVTVVLLRRVVNLEDVMTLRELLS